MTRAGRGRLEGAVAALLVALSAAPAAAQRAEPPCVLDKCLGLKPAPPQRSGGPEETAPAPGSTEPDAPAPATPTQGFRPRSATAPGNFDFYVLALSWSPGFCATGGAEKARSQCAEGSDLGFVVHGLWPQYAHGFPSDCGPAGQFPSRQALETVRGIYPDQGLARYEWTKHGTCSGKSPTDYFADVRRAREAIAIPQAFQAPHQDQTWVPMDVARAFAAANRGLRPDEMAVTCRQQTLEEVRVCLSKDLRGYVTCPEISRASCRTRQMNVPGLR